MIYEEKRVPLKSGEVLLRMARKEDASDLIDFLVQTAGETEYLLRYPEEIAFTVEGEECFIESVNANERSVMICAYVDGFLAGNCSFSGGSTFKTKHVAEIGIALKKDFWGKGIGTILLNELESVARTIGLERLMLEVVGENKRAIALYERMGYTVYGVQRDGFRLKEGYTDRIYMEKKL